VTDYHRETAGKADYFGKEKKRWVCDKPFDGRDGILLARIASATMMQYSPNNFAKKIVRGDMPRLLDSAELLSRYCRRRH
jgi:hypothetical protein